MSNNLEQSDRSQGGGVVLRYIGVHMCEPKKKREKGSFLPKNLHAFYIGV